MVAVIHTRISPVCTLLLLVGAAVSWAVFPAPAAAQEGGPEGTGSAVDGPAVARLVAEPAELEVVRGDSVRLRIGAFDSDGEALDARLRISAPRDKARVQDGWVKGLAPGDYTVYVSSVPTSEDVERVTLEVPLRVLWPPVERVEVVVESAGGLYRGVSLQHDARALHGDGSERPDVEFRWSSSDPGVATVDRFGRVRGQSSGEVTITAEFEGRRGSVRHEVVPLPARELEILGGQEQVRVGDVQSLRAVATGPDGRSLEVPVTWSYLYTPHDSIRAPAGTAFQDEGRIVADVPGIYTVVATAGDLVAEWSFEAQPRDVVQGVEVMDVGRLQHVYTTDLWVFEGVDGRDYAITGSKRVGGKAYFWDVTDPGKLALVDSIQVDARTVNDVKVSPDGRYAAISREGASNRRNGVVLIDLADPANPVVASNFDDGLTGGVHNVFATDDYLFALSNGEKYLILDVRDIYDPKYVSEYDHHPDSRIHDVWVHDGIAYSSEWATGVVMVDVGNGRWGGSPENPVLIGTYQLPSRRTHAIFPYASQSTDRFYLFVGDEILNREGLAWQGNGPDHRDLYDPETGEGGYPRATSGYIQIVDATDPENLEMVGRYEVKEYGTHNMWVADDKLYQAYYEGGLRVVDVSGELMGNLYTQEREIAVFKPNDPIGRIPNAPATWGAMPYKGYIFFSDINSGLWAVKLQPEGKPVT